MDSDDDMFDVFDQPAPKALEAEEEATMGRPAIAARAAVAAQAQQVEAEAVAEAAVEQESEEDDPASWLVE